MCSRRAKTHKQILIDRNIKDDNASANEQIKNDEMSMKILVVYNVDSIRNANKVANISSLPKCHLRDTTASSTTASQLFTNLMCFTVITMLYFLLSLSTPSLTEAAPTTPWTNAYGCTLAYDSADEQPINKPLRRGEKREVSVREELEENILKKKKRSL